MAKKKKPKKKVNKSRAVAPVIDDLEKEIDLLVETGDFNDTRKVKLFYYLGLGHSVAKAGVLAGFSSSYSQCKLPHIYKTAPSYRRAWSEFIKNVPAHMREFTAMQTLLARSAIDKAVARYNEDPDLLINKPQLAKMLFASSGITTEEPPQQTTINIKGIQELMIEVGQERRRRLNGDAVDVTPEREEERDK